MESEAPADVRIYFKDKQNELKGPYTERQVQDWYRQNWFDSSFPFYFMTGDERPTEQTEFLTLDTLRTLNGIGCPFAPVEPESNSEKMEEKIAKLEKDLADLSQKCDGVKEMEKRLEDVEKRLKELSAQPPPTSNSSAVDAVAVAVKAPASVTVAKKPEKQPEENSEHAKLANDWAAYYLEVLEAYKTNNWEKVGGENGQGNVLAISAALAEDAEPFRQKCREVLLKKLVELDYVYCSECDSIFHNFKQILLHAMAERHNTGSDDLHDLQKTVNIMMLEIFRSLIVSLTKAEKDSWKEMTAKYQHIKPFSPHLRPVLGFVDHLMDTYSDAVFDYSGHLNSNRAQIVAKMIPRLKQNDIMGRKIMSKVHEHIGDAQTRCYECGVVTGSRAEYYQHLRTLGHLNKADFDDLITLVVNMYQKN